MPTYVADFEGVRIQAISAGGFHSIVLTAAGDLYGCGLNKEGQLGLDHLKSKTMFCHITALGGINIQKFYAQGNHTWFQIDEFLPYNPNYKMPAPIGPKAKSKQKDKAADGKDRGAGGAGAGGQSGRQGANQS